MWKKETYLKMGKENQYKNRDSDNCIHYGENQKIQVISLTRGNKENEHANVGANIAGKAVIQLILEYYDDLYEAGNEIIQLNVISNILKNLYQYCKEEQIYLSEVETTVMFGAINLEKNTFIAFHLGDGYVGFTKDKQPHIMSYPNYGRNKEKTYYVTMPSIIDKARVFKGELGDIDSFILISKGWNDYGRLIDSNQLIKLGESINFEEDTSFITLTK